MSAEFVGKASKEASSEQRDHSLFEAELSGNVLNLSLLRRVLGWLVPYRFSLIVSSVLVLAASLATVMMEIVISRVLVDYVIVGEQDSMMPDFGLIALTKSLSNATSLPTLWMAGVLFFAFMTIAALLGHWHRLTLVSAIVKALRDLRQDLFAHLETRPSSFYDRVPVGRVMTRVTNDIEALYEMLRGLGSLVGEFVPFFVALIIMLSTSIKLTLILLALVPLVGIATLFFRRATREIFRRVRNSVSSLNQYLQENLSGMTVVQLSERQKRNRAAYTEINRENLEQEYRSIRLTTYYGAFNDSLASVGLGIIIYYGAGAVVQDELSLGAVILFTRFMNMLFTPVVLLGEQLNVLFRAMASGERIFQALDWDEQIREPVAPRTLPDRLDGNIRFDRVNFAYEPGRPILRDLSLNIRAGEKLAIVGPTGSGKSTLIRLLGRFYDFDHGMIFIDNIDLQDIRSQDVRRRIGVVLQDFHIFSGSILDNITLGDPLIARERAIGAAKTVNAHGFISQIEGGYDALLAERGANLSQGQRQLLAFARVLAANPEILVLDEATASIDTETELLIQDALQKLMEGRTSILIAHRLRTIKEADRVLVLVDGEVKELGAHDDLIRAGGVYATLHALQFQDVAATSA